MKVIIIAEVDPDQLFGAITGGSKQETVGELVQQGLGWVSQSGIHTLRVIEPDEIHPNDATLGEEIRKTLIL